METTKKLNTYIHVGISVGILLSCKSHEHLLILTVRQDILSHICTYRHYISLAYFDLEEVCSKSLSSPSSALLVEAISLKIRL